MSSAPAAGSVTTTSFTVAEGAPSVRGHFRDRSLPISESRGRGEGARGDSLTQGRVQRHAALRRCETALL
eukprot:5903316-Prymnesium_polylepis.1